MQAITPETFKQRFPMIHLSEIGTAALLAALELRTQNAGELLIRQGQLSDTLYLLWSGRLQIIIGKNGTRLVLGELTPGCWVGEFGFIDPGPAAASVSVLEDATVLALTQHGMQQLHEASPNTASALLQTLSLDLAERLRNASTHTVEKNANDEYTLQRPPEEQESGWLNRIGRKLMGLTRE